jgi:hypothetical protein
MPGSALLFLADACRGASGQVVVHLLERDFRSPRNPDLLRNRSDLLLGKAIELLARLPDVGDADALRGLGHPMGDQTCRACPARGEPHLLDYLIVLIQRCTFEIKDDTNSHTTHYTHTLALGTARSTKCRTRGGTDGVREMSGPGFAAGAWLAVVVGLALGGCGGSSSSPSSSSGAGAGTQTSAPAISVPAGSSFCSQIASLQVQFSALGRSAYGGSAGATPNAAAFKQLITAVGSAADALDSSAPSPIASSFHTLRIAYDQLANQVQSATSVQQAASLFASIDTQAVKDADTAVNSYIKNTCGVTPSP